MKLGTSLSIQYDNVFSPFPGREWENGLEWAKASGFDVVELILCDPSLLNVAAIVRKLEQLDLSVSTISTGQASAMEGLSMVSLEAGVRAATVERLCRDIDFSVQLGRPNVTIGLIRGRGGAAPLDVERNLLIHSLRAVTDYAATKDVTLNLEPINRYECCHFNTALSVLELIHELGDPSHVGVLYDTFHSNIEDVTMCGTIHALAGKISNIHIADSNRCLPGEGHVNFTEIARVLLQIEYTGAVTLEVLNRPNQEHIRKHAAASIRRYFQQGIVH